MAPVSENIIMKEFNESDIKLDDDSIVNKIKELCVAFDLNESGIVERWMAFAFNHRNCAVSIESLNQFEREVLSRKGAKILSTRKQEKQIKNVSYFHGNDDQGDDMLDVYGAPYIDGTNKPAYGSTPETKIKRISTKSPQVFGNILQNSPLSVKYTARNNSGEVVASWGVSPDDGSSTWKSLVSINDVNITTVSLCNSNEEMKYMFQKMSSKKNILIMWQKKMEEFITNILQEEVADVSLANQEEAVVIGKIATEGSEKPTPADLYLEGLGHGSKIIELDVTHLPQYSLFSGQLVAMKGTNRTGKKFVATKFFDIPPLKFADSFNLVEPLNLIIASGPLSLSDNTANEPLVDLINHLRQQPADVCILIGPFVDLANGEVQQGNIPSTQGDGTATYEDYFINILKYISEELETSKTQFVIVPSQRDVHHHPVFPQPPFSSAKISKRTDKKFERFHFITNPATININGVIIGLTSTDILLHMSVKELSFPTGATNRLVQLAEHLLRQHTYYPLYPPSEEVNFDYPLFGLFGSLPLTPHILVLPSSLRYFIKDIEGCLCINPNQLTKGQAGGTFARVVIQPSNSWSPNHVSACIQRI